MTQTNSQIREEWKKEFRKQFIWDDENELGMPTNPFPSSDRVISFIAELLKSQREEFVEKIMEVKYSSHNPTIDCVCKTCVICNKLLNNLK